MILPASRVRTIDPFIHLLLPSYPPPAQLSTNSSISLPPSVLYYFLSYPSLPLSLTFYPFPRSCMAVLLLLVDHARDPRGRKRSLRYLRSHRCRVWSKRDKTRWEQGLVKPLGRLRIWCPRHISDRLTIYRIFGISPIVIETIKEDPFIFQRVRFHS